ncbi:hypothetical protein NLI96_g9600 [Meripilus lineatus]|uniref:Phytocyanin domain-containing protein n=1 Tax=Meripilus lineatus TaxID=2056292 RepID=A0AAD5UVE9_9APHY|nr:hypothetical protein NLI96_g9600 [Physisporinus lineatus]
MRFATLLAALLPVGAALAQTNHVVKVGENAGLTFTPTEITAAAGDSVSFQFLSKNHTVTQSTFASPCANLTQADGTVVDSGFQPVAANATSFMQWTFTINNASAPLWFYCRQANHCKAGMVFAINPTAEKSFAAFQAAAMGTTASAGTSASGSAASASTRPTASVSDAGTPSPSASTTTNGAGSINVGAGALLAGLGLVAGLVL